jgi:opacity protein-like surface antigen
MKKVLVILAMALVSVANAQKGTVLLAGNVAIGSTKDSNISGNQKTNDFTFAPKIGYQFSDNMTVGIESSIGSTKTTTTPASGTSSETKQDNLNLGAFLRYSKSLGGAFSAYADLGVGMQSAKTSNNTPGSTAVKYNGFYVGVTPAVAIDLKKSFCLNFSIGGLGYNTWKDDTTNPTTTNNFGLTFGKQVNIGISKNF